jgi:hypothetical protein
MSFEELRKRFGLDELDQNAPAAESDIYAQRAAQIARFIQRNRDVLIAAWIAETGLLPSEAVLYEQSCADGTTRVWIEKQSDELQRWRACPVRDATLASGTCSRCGTRHGREEPAQ